MVSGLLHHNILFDGSDRLLADFLDTVLEAGVINLREGAFDALISEEDVHFFEDFNLPFIVSVVLQLEGFESFPEQIDVKMVLNHVELVFKVDSVKFSETEGMGQDSGVSENLPKNSHFDCERVPRHIQGSLLVLSEHVPKKGVVP